MTKAQHTIKVFWENPYLAELVAKIVDIDGDNIVLDQTIFYAFSGGQESDEGTMGKKFCVPKKKIRIFIIQLKARVA